MDHFPMRNQAPTPHNPQSGSIFIWIFVMIALFAAFSFAVSQGSRTGAASLTDQQAKLLASELIDFGRQMKDTINTMRLNNDCGDTQISFVGAAGNYTNPNSPADGSCDVFGTGGKMRIPDFGDDLSDDRLFFGPNEVRASDGAQHLGTSEPDLTMIRQIDATTCGQINKLLGNPVAWTSGSTIYTMWESGNSANGTRNLANDNWLENDYFQGDYSASGSNGIFYDEQMTHNGANYDSLKPPMTGCFCDAATDCAPPVKYYFYNVLWVR